MEIQASTGIHVCSRWKGREWWERCSGCAAVERGCRGESGLQLHCKASFTVSRHQLPGCHGNSPTLAEGGSIEVSREMGVMEEEGGERKGRMFLVNVRCYPCYSYVCKYSSIPENGKEAALLLSSTSASFPYPCTHVWMQPDMEAEKNNMPTADCSFSAAYYQHFCPKLPVYCTHNWAISLQLDL